MSGSNQHNAQVHAEVEHLEDLWFGEGEHNDTGEFGQRDASQYTAAGNVQGIGRSRHCCARIRCVRSNYMWYELHTNSDWLRANNLFFFFK